MGAISYAFFDGIHISHIYCVKIILAIVYYFMYQWEMKTNKLNWIELNWIELNWIELNWIELNWIELNRTELN